MLGYIPAETDGQVSSSRSDLRGASTIVFEPLMQLNHSEKSFLPEQFAELIQELAAQCDVKRAWEQAESSPAARQLSDVTITEFVKRDLVRLEFSRVGADVAAHLDRFTENPGACKQIDFRLDDDANGYGVGRALDLGFVFCGWLPGYRESDVLRLQLIDGRSDLSPGVVNPMGQRLSAMIRQSLDL